MESLVDHTVLQNALLSEKTQRIEYHCWLQSPQGSREYVQIRKRVWGHNEI